VRPTGIGCKGVVDRYIVWVRLRLHVGRYGALNVITSVQKNAGVDERYERKVAKDDESYFVLLAANKEVIGRSQLYKSKESLEKGIASVKKNGPTAPIKDLTHPAPKAK
jgi:uncharacterized protein